MRATLTILILIGALLGLSSQAQILIYNGIIRTTTTGNGEQTRELLRGFLVIGPEADAYTLITYSQEGRLQIPAVFFDDESPTVDLASEWDSASWEELTSRNGLPVMVLTAYDIDDLDSDSLVTLYLQGYKRRALLYRDGRERVFVELARLLGGSALERDQAAGTLTESFLRFRLDRLTQGVNLQHAAEPMTHQEAVFEVYNSLNLGSPPTPSSR